MKYSNSLSDVTAEVADAVTDSEFRLAVLVAVSTIPFTVVLSWRENGSAVAGVPLVIAGLVVGFLYNRRSIDVRRAGALAGIVASTGVVGWQLWRLAALASGESNVRLLGLVLSAPFVAVIGVALSVLLVAGSALFAGWLASRF